MYPRTPAADAKDVTSATDTETAPEKGYLGVLDTKTGNLAVKPLAGLKGKLNLAAADFSDVGQVKVDVQYSGKPLVAANVDLKDGRGSQSSIIDASKNGEVSFYGVKSGPLSVTVRYVSAGKDASPVQLSFDLKSERTDPIPTFKAAVPEEALTVAGGLTPTSTTGTVAPNSSQSGAGKTTPSSTGQMLAKTLQMLFGFAIVAALVYLVWWIFRSHPGALKDKLEGLGVQIPKDPNDPTSDAPVIPATPIQAAPVEKIMLADSDPTPLSAPLPPAISQTPSVPGQAPHLVSDSGSPMTFSEGVTEFGRDQAGGHGIADPSTLSRRHAEFIRAGESLSVRDLGSTNGTYVNGRKIDSETPLRPGDTVQLGAVRMRVEA